LRHENYNAQFYFLRPVKGSRLGCSEAETQQKNHRPAMTSGFRFSQSVSGFSLPFAFLRALRVLRGKKPNGAAQKIIARR
jgi:hypothetical protein